MTIPDAFYSLPALTELEITENGITTPLPDRIYSFPALTTLRVARGNSIPNLEEVKKNAKFAVR